jgi:hypothetical protein
MKLRSTATITSAFFMLSGLGSASLLMNSGRAQAQQSIALKNGENTELGSVWFVANCRSILMGVPEVEILEGPPGLTLSIKEAMVVPRRLNCANQVSGGILVATAKDITEPVQGKLTYRIKYKTKDGDRQRSNTYNVSLFP